ncbi:MAG: DUF1540 domain-containing protein [Oscillospiraceae bacterium]|nr:DUF1540 domain-containing protein [Oscillospiraceae bacterium]
MPQLSCGVTECSYNAQAMCSLNNIDVTGGECKDGTCCESFSTASYSSNCCSNPESQTGVHCEAHDCKHNEHCSCHADSIEICNCGSGCSCDDTACATFKKR